MLKTSYFLNTIDLIWLIEGHKSQIKRKKRRCLFIDPPIDESLFIKKARFLNKTKDFFPSHILQWYISPGRNVDLQMLELGSPSHSHLRIRQVVGNISQLETKFPYWTQKRYQISPICVVMFNTIQKILFLLVYRRLIWFSVKDRVWLWCIGLKTNMEMNIATRRTRPGMGQRLSPNISWSQLHHHIWSGVCITQSERFWLIFVVTSVNMSQIVTFLMFPIHSLHLRLFQLLTARHSVFVYFTTLSRSYADDTVSMTGTEIITWSQIIWRKWKM